MNNTDTLKILVNELFEKYEQPTPYEVYTWLINKQHKIAGAYEDDCHRQDVIDELTEQNYLVEKIPQQLIDDIVWEFCDRLGNQGSEFGWRDVLDAVIDCYNDDLKEYKGEE